MGFLFILLHCLVDAKLAETRDSY